MEDVVGVSGRWGSDCERSVLVPIDGAMVSSRSGRLLEGTSLDNPRESSGGSGADTPLGVSFSCSDDSVRSADIHTKCSSPS